MDFKKLGEDLLEKIKTYRADKEGWKVVKQSDDATVSWKKSSDWNGVIYKAEGFVDCDPDTVFHYINPCPDDSPRNKWDDSIKERKIVEKLDEKHSILRTVTRSALGGLISHREFIDLLVIDITDDHLSTNVCRAAFSVKYDKVSADPTCVLGTNHPSALVCERVPGEPKKTHLVNFIQTDLGGMVPQSLTDQAIPNSQTEFFISLKKALKDDGH